MVKLPVQLSVNLKSNRKETVLMALREILTVPDPRLRKVSAPVRGGVTEEIRTLMNDMLETMYAAPGIGLAAIQIGVPLRVIVMDLSEEKNEPRYFVNPEILSPSDNKVPFDEGCLSVPEINGDVYRSDYCKIRYLNYSGEEVIEEAQGLFAVCIQHEMDHLEGILFIDHFSRLRREQALKKLRKSKQESRSTHTPNLVAA